ncbi:hypothetical protein BGZ59_003699, partial [Podila verticillata]
MKAPKISLPPMPRLMAQVNPKYKYALHYDISNGFDHIPRHPDSQPYFAIQVDGEFYQSSRIMMGETCAPWAFQIWLNDMFNAFIQETGLTFKTVKKQHIDDLLFLFTSTAQARVFREHWETWCRDHGVLLNLKKSMREPSHLVEHIGFHLNLKTRQAMLTTPRQE